MEKIIEGSYKTADEAIQAVDRLTEEDHYLSQDITIVTNNENRMTILEETSVQVDKVELEEEKSGWERFKEILVGVDTDEPVLERYGITEEEAQQYKSDVSDGYYIIILSKDALHNKKEAKSARFNEAFDRASEEGTIGQAGEGKKKVWEHSELETGKVSASDGNDRLNNAEKTPKDHPKKQTAENNTADQPADMGEALAHVHKEEKKNPTEEEKRTVYIPSETDEILERDQEESDRLNPAHSIPPEQTNPDANVGNEDLSNRRAEEERPVVSSEPIEDRRSDTRDVVTPPSGELNELNRKNLRKDDIPGEATTAEEDKLPRSGWVGENDPTIPKDPDLRADFPDESFDKDENR